MMDNEFSSSSWTVSTLLSNLRVSSNGPFSGRMEQGVEMSQCWFERRHFGGMLKNAKMNPYDFF